MAVTTNARYNPASYVYGKTTQARKPPVSNQPSSSAMQALFSSNHPDSPAFPAPQTQSSAPPSSQSSQQNAANTGTATPASSQYIPGEGIYAADSAAAYDAYNAAMAAADKDTQSARAQYGFNADGSNLDASNSTGLMQRLMRSQAQQGEADHEEAIGRGLGGSGLGAQIGEQHDFQNQGDLADLTNNYQGLLAAAMSNRGNAGTNLTNALLTARQNQLMYDLQNQMFTPAGDGGGGGDQKPPADTAVPEAPQTYFNPVTKKTVNYRPVSRTGPLYAQ